MALTTIDDRGLKTPIDLLNNEKIRFGTGNDLEIYHNGTDTFIHNQGANAGNFYIRGAGADVDKWLIIQAKSGEDSIVCKKDAEVFLAYDGVKKLETSAGGADVTGGFSVTGDVHFNSATNAGKDVYWDESESQLQFNDSTYATFGTAEDLKIYHDGTNSFVDSSQGELRLYGTNGTIRIRPTNAEDSIVAVPNGTVELYYDNSKKFETYSGGNKSIGNFLFDNGSGTEQLQYDATNNKLKFNDNVNANFGGIYLRVNQTEAAIAANKNGAVELYYDNVKKFETTSLGIQITDNLGIGVAPSRELHVKGLDGTIRLESTAATGRTWIEFFDTSAIKGSIGYPSSGNDHFAIQQTENADMWFSTNDTERLRIDSSGRLLLGTTTPGSADADDITIAGSGNSGLSIRSGNTSSGIIYFSDGTSGAAQYAGFIQYSHGSTNAMYFGANSATQMEIHGNSGNVKINDGDLVIGTSGHGIDFSATAGTGTTEVLNDYEHGTFTARVSTNGNAPTISGTTDWTGYYTKVGNLVHVNCYIGGSNVTNGGTGSCKITGLPYNCKDRYTAITITHNTLVPNADNGYIAPNQSFFYPITEDSTGAPGLNTGTNYMMFAGTYLTDQY